MQVKTIGYGLCIWDSFDTIGYMVLIWDYDIKELKKTEKGRIFLLERLINYGPSNKGEKIKLSMVKKYWDKLDLYPEKKHLLEYFIWGKCISSHPNRSIFSIK